MKMSKKCSIIIRTKNEERWILLCLATVYSQTYKNFEVIIVDNDSTDKTIEKSKNIDLLGYVESPEIFWNQISTLIVPIGEGAGSNIKIAEAFIYGKAVIANPFASRGYENFLDSAYLILPKNNEEWIESMTSINVISSDQSNILSTKAKKLFDFW